MLLDGVEKHLQVLGSGGSTAGKQRQRSAKGFGNKRDGSLTLESASNTLQALNFLRKGVAGAIADAKHESSKCEGAFMSPTIMKS